MGEVINRRHIEPYWPKNHIKYFLSFKKNNVILIDAIYINNSLKYC